MKRSVWWLLIFVVATCHCLRSMPYCIRNDCDQENAAPNIWRIQCNTMLCVSHIYVQICAISETDSKPKKTSAHFSSFALRFNWNILYLYQFSVLLNNSKNKWRVEDKRTNKRKEKKNILQIRMCVYECCDVPKIFPFFCPIFVFSEWFRSRTAL